MSMHPGDPAAPDPGVEELMDLAERLARSAGELVRVGRPSEVSVAETKSSPTDVVTAMDMAAEGRLREMLRAERPDDGVLGEEDGHHTGGSGITWVLDPIDGTVNYLYGIPVYAVCVAAVTGPPDPAHWTVLAGCVHNAADGRTWTAGLGRGAYRDGRAIRANEPRALAQSLLGTGFGYDARVRTEQARIVAQVLPKVRDIRRLGAAAVDLCLVAEGSLDLYYERGLQPWDLAAGSLVATEAGAVVTGLGGRPADSDMVIAGPEPSVVELERLLLALGADRDESAERSG